VLWCKMRSQTGLAICDWFVVFSVVAATGGCRMAADGHNLDGVRLYQQGSFNPAMQRFQKALAANPDNPDTYYNLARTEHHLASQRNDTEAYDRAEMLYNQCLDLDENHVDCHRGLAVLLAETERSNRAIKLMQNWARANPTSSDPRVELARLYDEFGETETAKMHLNEALSLNQYDHRAWAALGRIRDEEGEHEQALADYQWALHLNQFQPAVAERVATLSRSMRADRSIAGPGGTRTVANPAHY
jgi:tetratricopeptide (TPR) repeat protein